MKRILARAAILLLVAAAGHAAEEATWGQVKANLEPVPAAKLVVSATKAGGHADYVVKRNRPV